MRHARSAAFSLDMAPVIVRGVPRHHAPHELVCTSLAGEPRPVRKHARVLMLCMPGAVPIARMLEWCSPRLQTLVLSGDAPMHDVAFLRAFQPPEGFRTLALWDNKQGCHRKNRAGQRLIAHWRVVPDGVGDVLAPLFRDLRLLHVAAPYAPYARVFEDWGPNLRELWLGATTAQVAAADVGPLLTLFPRLACLERLWLGKGMRDALCCLPFVWGFVAATAHMPALRRVVVRSHTAFLAHLLLRAHDGVLPAAFAAIPLPRHLLDADNMRAPFVLRRIGAEALWVARGVRIAHVLAFLGLLHECDFMTAVACGERLDGARTFEAYDLDPETEIGVEK